MSMLITLDKFYVTLPVKNGFRSLHLLHCQTATVDVISCFALPVKMSDAGGFKKNMKLSVSNDPNGYPPNHNC